MRRTAVERHVNLQSFRSRDLCKRFEFDHTKRVAQQDRHATAVDDVRAASGIEIENDVRRFIDLRRAMEEWMELDAADFGDPRQRPNIIDEDVFDR